MHASTLHGEMIPTRLYYDKEEENLETMKKMEQN